MNTLTSGAGHFPMNNVDPVGVVHVRSQNAIDWGRRGTCKVTERDGLE